MNYYRLSCSTDLAELGACPQIADWESQLGYDDSTHLFQLELCEPISRNTYIPVSLLKPEARLTDFLSIVPGGNFLVSAKVRSLVKGAGIPDVQFVHMQVKQLGQEHTYYLMRFTRSAVENLDFSQSEVEILDAGSEVHSAFMVADDKRFDAVLETVEPPFSVLIRKPRLLGTCTAHIFAIKHVYNGFQCFISEEMAALFKSEGVTGIELVHIQD